MKKNEEKNTNESVSIEIDVAMLLCFFVQNIAISTNNLYKVADLHCNSYTCSDYV